MKGMERQALKTDAAVASLGATLDTVGSRKQSRQMGMTGRDLRTLGVEADNAGKKAGGAERQFRKMDNQVERIGGTAERAAKKLGSLMVLMKPILWTGIGAAIGVVVQAVGALSGGVIALVPRLTDLTGLAAPAVAGITGIGIAAIATKLALTGLSQAYNGNKKALKELTPEARNFLAQLKQMKPFMRDLRQSSQQGLFPGLTRTLQRVQGARPQLSNLLRGGGSAVGDSVSTIANSALAPSALGDTGLLAGQGFRMIRQTATALTNLLGIVRNFGVAAMPFTNWLTQSVVLWSKHRLVVSQFNRDSGKTAAFLDRTKVALRGTVRMVELLWGNFKILGQAARPLGDQLYGSMNRALQKWQDFHSLTDQRVGLTRDFLAMGAAIRQITGLASDLGAAIFRMGTDGHLGHTVQSLRDLVPTLEKVLTLLADKFGPAIASMLTSIGDLAVSLSGATGPLVLAANLLSRMLELIADVTHVIPGLGQALGTALSVVLISRFLIKIGLLEKGWWRVGMAARSAAAAEAAAMGASAGGGVSPLVYGFRSGRAGSTLVGGGFGRTAGIGAALGRGRTGSLIAGAGRIGGRFGGPLAIGATAAGLGLQFAPVSSNVKSIGQGAVTGAALGAMLGSAVPILGTGLGAGVGALAGGGLAFMQNRGKDSLPGRVQGDVASQLQGTQNFPTQIGRLTAQLAIYQNAQRRLQNDRSQDAMAERAAIAQEIQARQSVIAQLRAEQKQRKAAADQATARGVATDLGKAYDFLRAGGSSKASAAGFVNRKTLSELQGMTDPKARLALARGTLNWERGILGAKSPVYAGLRSSLQGVIPGLIQPGTTGYHPTGSARDINTITNQMLPGRGGYVEQLRQRRAKAPTKLQGALILELLAAGFDGPSAREIVMRWDAVGGPPLIPSTPTPGPAGTGYKVKQNNMHAAGGRLGGAGLQDSVPLTLGMAAPGELIVNRHQERMADALLGGSGALAGIVHGVKKPHSSGFAAGGRLAGLRSGISGDASTLLGRFPGLSVTSTTGGTHAKNSYHYRGMAVDLGGSSSTMNAAARWIVSSGMYRSLLEGIHNPGLSVKNGQVVPAGFWGASWGQHANHLHLAAGTAAALGGGGGGAGGAAAAPGGVRLGGLFGAAARHQLAMNQVQGFARFGAGGGGGAAVSGGKPVSGAPVSGGATGGSRALGRRMMLAHGWGGAQWPALNALWTGESNWSASALNKSSGALGIPQLLPSAHGGVPAGYAGNARNQINWGLNYIAGRYGTPSAAYAAWQGRSPHWYQGGGRLKYAGAFAKGGKFTTNGPTAFVAGDNASGRETVTVSRGGGIGPAVHIENLNVDYHRPGDAREAIVREVRQAFSDLTDELSRTSPMGVSQ